MARLVYGVHPVEEALRRRNREVQALMIARRGAAPPGLLELAEARGIPVQTSSPEELDLLCGAGNHQGVAALVGEYAYVELEDLLEPGPAVSSRSVPQGREDRGPAVSSRSVPQGREDRGPAAQGREDRPEPPLLLVLDCVTDPQNVGAILRSALVLGASGLVLPKDRAAPITPAVVRVSAGASEHLRCARVTNLARALEQMKEAGLWVAGAVESGGVAPEQADLRGPAAIVLGNEQKGIRPLVRRGCDLLITIPSRSAIASLNVAAAGVTLLYEAARQRRAPAPGGEGRR